MFEDNLRIVKRRKTGLKNIHPERSLSSRRAVLVVCYFDRSEPSKEAAAVQQIFAWHTEEGWSLRKIAIHLNQTGVPLRRKGGRWGASRISTILDQQVYAGKTYNNRYRTRPESVGRLKKQGRGRMVSDSTRARSADSSWWLCVSPFLGIMLL